MTCIILKLLTLCSMGYCGQSYRIFTYSMGCGHLSHVSLQTRRYCTCFEYSLVRRIRQKAKRHNEFTLTCFVVCFKTKSFIASNLRLVHISNTVSCKEIPQTYFMRRLVVSGHFNPQIIAE